MAHTSLCGWHRGRTTTILGGLLLAGLVIGMTPPGEAQGPSKTDPKPKPKPKPVTVPVPPPLNFTVASDDDTVADTVKFINEQLAETWKKNSIVHARWATDEEFIRRASLDIIGRIATPEEIVTFLRDPVNTRRSKLIDRLLKDSPEYPFHMADLWTNWLLTRSGLFGRGQYHRAMNDWLKDKIALNTSYDKIVRELITASGKNKGAEGESGVNGAVNFILAHTGENVPAARQGEDGHFEMVPITSRITRLFLGVQVQCAQCHNHPFTDSIKQKHFWGVNAFLRQIKRDGMLPMQQNQRPASLPTLTLIDDTNVADKPVVFYEQRNGVVLQTKAEFLPAPGQDKGPRLSASANGNQRRVELANFVIEHENFPKAIVNRMWGVFMGRGFTNPIDDFNDQNAPSMPELLNGLADRFKNYNYNQKKLIRWICNSNAYQLSIAANPTNDKQEQEPLFSRMLMKSMTPEQLFESLQVATNAKRSANTEEGRKKRDDWMGKLVSNFGDDEGNEVNFNGTVVQALLMMNGPDINEAISRKENGTVAKILARNRQASAIVTELYLTTLNRRPTPKELKEVIGSFPLFRTRDKDASAPYYDTFWALLNSNEFMLNH